VLEARVLQAFQGGRYLLDFQGQQKVVDSSVPLQDGQVLRARVIAVGEQVVLEKLLASAAPNQNDTTAMAPPPWLLQARNEDALSLFQQHSSMLSMEEWVSVGSAARTMDAEQAVLSALTLKQLGLPQDPALMAALALALSSASSIRPGQAAITASYAAATPAARQSASDIDAHARLLAETSEAELNDVPGPTQQRQNEHTGDNPDRQSSDQQAAVLQQALAMRMLNAQQPGALAHRIMSLPLIIDGRLVELNMAMFDPADKGELNARLEQRSLRITLELDALGKVDVLARITESHLHIQMLTDTESGAESLGAHDAELMQALGALNLIVDGVRYGMADTAQANAVVRCVMERAIIGRNFSMVA
jgi:hypothetical protein